MECKNCSLVLKTDYSYCPKCGAKIILNRITLKNLFNEFTESFLNVDNTFLKTFLTLFKKPEDVIDGYINGVRKKYVNPLNYLALSIILSSLLFWILKNGYGIKLIETKTNNSGINVPDLDFLMDYQALTTYLFLPIFALMTLITFLDIKKYNYAEHLVVNAYVVAQYSIIQFLICIPLLGMFDINYTNFNFYYLIFVVLYLYYCLKKIYKITILSTLTRAFLFSFQFILLFIMFGFLFAIYMFATGQFTLPK